MSHDFNGSWSGPHLNRLAMPMGGIGAGMIALEGTGTLGQVSLRHAPAVFNEPYMYAAICLRPPQGDPVARLLEGPVPTWKTMHPWGTHHEDSGTGGRGRTYGLPRFAESCFDLRFPFGTVSLFDSDLPVQCRLTGWSPFIPASSDGADASSLPVLGLEYALTNIGDAPLDAVFSFHARNFLHADPRHRTAEFSPTVGRIDGGFRLDAPGFDDAPWAEGHFAVQLDDPQVAVDPAWFRGGWFDAHTALWRNVASGSVIDQPEITVGRASDGGSLYLPLLLQPGETRGLRLRMCWYMPHSDLGGSDGPHAPLASTPHRYVPWYASQFTSLEELSTHWRDQYDHLRTRTQRFTDAFYGMTLPAEVVEAVAANLAILKSPTVLRQQDGRLWAWEGCFDTFGCCPGSCTHVWNYAQALPHLFPDLERTLRETEFEVAQAGADDGDHAGHQAFRVALPISEPSHDHHAAADGQLGGIIKAYRDWRISGDDAWLARLWPRIKESLDYCIAAWDPDHRGVPHRPQHNTYDIEFWGPNGMIGSFYAGALQAAIEMGRALDDVDDLWLTLLERCRAAMETDLFNGEYFIQRIDRAAGQRRRDPESPEAEALFGREGPKYQYGDGCLSDGVLGMWMTQTAGLPAVLDRDKIASHLDAVFRYNFKPSLAAHANTQRPTYAMGDEAGLILCTWPRGGRLTLPFPYADEVWTGIEYQVASHLMRLGRVEQGLTLVRAARARYDGVTRNPFDEFECGHWYARAMASYALIFGLTGIRYDAVDRTLHVDPVIDTPFTSFLSTATGFGAVRVEGDAVTVDVREGQIPLTTIRLRGRDITPRAH